MLTESGVQQLPESLVKCSNLEIYYNKKDYKVPEAVLKDKGIQFHPPVHRNLR